MKNKFLTISIGVTIMLLGAGFFVRSIQTVNAAPSPQAFIDEGTSKIGKYQMVLTNTIKDGNSIIKILVYDTESGQSKLYTSFNLAEFAPSDIQIPQSPMGN